MFESLPYARSAKGVETPGMPPVYLYGLTACEHCKEGRQLLEEHRIPFSMVYLDALTPEIRRPVLTALREQYGQRVLYPVLEVDGEYTFGFDRDAWEKIIGSLTG